MIKAVDLNLSHPHIHRQFPMGNLIGCCLQRHRWWSLARDDKEGQVSEFGSCWSAARVQWPHGSSMLILKFIFNKRIQGRYVKEPKYLSYICTYYRNQVSCRWKSSQWCIPAMSSGFMWKVCNLHKPWEPLASYLLFTSLLDNFLLVGTINPVLTVTQLLLHSHVRTWKASKRITGAFELQYESKPPVNVPVNCVTVKFVFSPGPSSPTSPRSIRSRTGPGHNTSNMNSLPRSIDFSCTDSTIYWLTHRFTDPLIHWLQ